MHRNVRIAMLALLALTAGCASKGDPVVYSQKPTPADAINPADARTLAIVQLKPSSAKPMMIKSPAFEAGGEIPYKYSEYGEKISPELTIGDVPPGAASLVLLVEDPDAPIKPFVHWTLFNVPPDRTHLRESMPAEMRLRDLGAANQGLNSYGSVGYTGMKPPYQDPAHHYHFQVFALDTKLEVAPGSSRDALLSAMRGHVLAAGSMIGTYKAAK